MLESGLSVVIPAYNEEDTIQDTLIRINNFLSDHFKRYEIIVVEDGSSDSTYDKIQTIAKEGFVDIKIFKSNVNKGKGASVRKGILGASLDYVLFTDADLSTPIQEVLKLESFFLSGADVVIGSRALKESKVIKKQKTVRQNMGRTFNIFVQMILFRGIKDTQCGFKCFKREVGQRLFRLQQMDGFSFDAEILFLAKKFGYKIIEMPVQWINREQSRVHIFKDSFRMLMDLLKIRLNDQQGKY